MIRSINWFLFTRAERSLYSCQEAAAAYVHLQESLLLKVSVHDVSHMAAKALTSLLFLNAVKPMFRATGLKGTILIRIHPDRNGRKRRNTLKISIAVLSWKQT